MLLSLTDKNNLENKYLVLLEMENIPLPMNTDISSVVEDPSSVELKLLV